MPPTPSASSPLARWSLTQWGVAAVALAVALGLLPSFAGVGWFWSVILLLLSALVWRRETGAAFEPGSVWASPGFGLAYAALVAAWAWQLLSLDLVPLLWVGAACLLGLGLLRQARAENWRQQWDLSRLRRGYGLYVALGAAVCFLSLLLMWGQTPGFLNWGTMGGMNYTLAPDPGGSGYATWQWQYSPNMYLTTYGYFPGFELSGRGRPLALWAELALLGLLAWAARARPAGQAVAGPTRVLGLALVGFVALWWLNASRDLGEPRVWGPLLFVAGLGSVAVGVWFLLHGQTAGNYDPAQMSRKVRERLEKKS